jgi:sialate O-acetylesterase
LWAAADFDSRGWPSVQASETTVAGLQGYAGTVWFRKTIDVQPDQAGKALVLHLGNLVNADTTYFNGEAVGESKGYDIVREYAVPGQRVRAGRNVVTIRLTGTGPILCLCGDESSMYAEIGTAKITLADVWSYQAAPDLTDYPQPPPMAVLNEGIPLSPTLLFNGMISPLASFTIKGAIWYQGESNVDRAAQYRTLFPALVKDWRSQWGYDFPFLFVQLAGFGVNKEEPSDYPWADLREAQTLALLLPNTGMATAVDIGDPIDAHPRNKQEVGHRLALVARNVVYGEDVVHSGPTYASMQIEGSRIRIRFTDLGSGLWIKGKSASARGFEIAGADGRFVWARAERDGDDIIVSNDTLQLPVAVRYNWSNMPEGNLFNKEGLPALPFRTDADKH